MQTIPSPAATDAPATAHPSYHPPGRLWLRWTRSAAAVLLVTLTSLGHGQGIPAIINYQGRLTDSLGAPVVSGYYEIQFRIWDDATQNGAGNLVWARSFPLHVVTNGVFNVLLSDAGGKVTTPTEPSATLLEAFNGPDRYLGLTITLSNNVSVTSTEISPRQQLASAPFAVHAQTASATLINAVGSDSLQSASVTAAKLAANAVVRTNIASGAVTTTNLTDAAITTAKIGDSQVTTAKLAANAVTTTTITNGAVTASKLNIDGNFHLNDHTVYLRGGSDTNHGAAWVSTFAGSSVDGPALFGFTGGVLGTTSGGAKRQLAWDQAAGVSLFGSMVDLSTHVASANTSNPTTFTANTDGLMMYYGRRGQADLQVWINGGTTALFAETSSIKGAVFWFNGDANDGRSVMWPIKKGDKFRWNIHTVDTGSTYNPINNKLYFLPLGLSQSSSSISPN